MTRGNYATIQILTAAVRVADSGFCSDDDEQEWTLAEREAIQKELANQCSKWQLENAIAVLEASLKLK